MSWLPGDVTAQDLDMAISLRARLLLAYYQRMVALNGSLFGGQLDLGRVMFAGHSTGGGAAAEAGRMIQSVINIKVAYAMLAPYFRNGPAHPYVGLDTHGLFVMHGTLLGNRAGIYPFTSNESVRSRIVPDAKVFVTAHTHVPHRRFLDGVHLINIGSVGVPGDGDGRAAYGRMTWTRSQGWQAGIARVAFDRAAADHDYFASGFMDEAGPEAELSLVQYRLARDVRTRWSAEYRRPVLAGEISLAESLGHFLAQDEFRPFRAGSNGESGRPGVRTPHEN